MPLKRFIPRFFVALSAMIAASRAMPSSAVELIGYVPYYRMGDANYVNNVLPTQLSMLSEVRYFGVTVTATGALTTTAADLANIATLAQKISLLPPTQRPRLDITLGGDGATAGFGTVAASSALRTQLAQNIQALLVQTGAVGVDVDWEHPADGVPLSIHYPALLSRIKQEVGADHRVYATVSPEKILPRSVFEGANAVSGVSLMTYDIGWWANDPADPNLNQHSLPEYVADSVNAWTNTAGASIPRTYVFGSKKSIDAPEDKLGVGAPLYARGYNGSDQNLAVAYRDLANLSSADGNAYQYQGSNVWLPGPSLLADRVQYAYEHGLQHIIFWEMYHDLPPTDARSLLRAAFTANVAVAAAHGDFNADGVSNAIDLDLWRQHFGLAAGALASDGDADADGDVDGADLLVWQKQARTIPAVAAAQAAPEPSTMELLLFVAAGKLLPAQRRATR